MLNLHIPFSRLREKGAQADILQVQLLEHTHPPWLTARCTLFLVIEKMF